MKKEVGLLSETDLVLFLTTPLVVIVAPGPDNNLVLTRGMALKRKEALVSATGASVGLVTHSRFTAAGVSALRAQSAFAFSVVKYVGAVYLIFLGIRTLLVRENFVLTQGAAPVGLRNVFVQAVASNVLNPKIAVFSLAYLPQSADRGRNGAATAGVRRNLRPATLGVLLQHRLVLGGLGRAAPELPAVRYRPGLVDRRRPDRARPAAGVARTSVD